MQTFFSTTDIATLCKEAVEQSHFVSLIVNNAGTYNAAITRKVTSIKHITEEKSYNTFDDVVVTDDTKNSVIDSTYLEYFELIVTRPDVEKNEMLLRLREIESKKCNCNAFTQELKDNIYLDDDLNLKVHDVTKDLKIKSTVLANHIAKIFTGNYLMTSDVPMSFIKDKPMVSYYNNEFGCDTSMTRFEEYADIIMDLLYQSVTADDFDTLDNRKILIDNDLDIEDIDIIEIWRRNLLEALYKLNNNPYLSYYKKVLKDGY